MRLEAILCLDIAYGSLDQHRQNQTQKCTQDITHEVTKDANQYVAFII